MPAIQPGTRLGVDNFPGGVTHLYNIDDEGHYDSMCGREHSFSSIATINALNARFVIVSEQLVPLTGIEDLCVECGKLYERYIAPIAP